MLRDHQKQERFVGPRFLVHVAALEMHPLDTADRTEELKEARRHRLLQHHEVLHEGLSREHPHHGQRDHSAQGARGGPVLRSAEGARAARAREAAMTFELKRLSAAALPRALELRRALPPAQRTVGGGEHLPRHPGRGAGPPAGAQGAAARAVRPVRPRDRRRRAARARRRSTQLTSEYERTYYTGLILERRAKARLDQRAPGAGFVAYEWLREAMELVREGRGAAADGQRRCAAALEHLRAAAERHAERGGARRGAGAPTLGSSDNGPSAPSCGQPTRPSFQARPG